jgi:hypothetical protein
MPAIVVLEITIHKLGFHRRLDLAVPAAFHLNYDLELVEFFAARIASHRVHVDVRALLDVDLNLSVKNDASGGQQVLQLDLYPVREFFLILRTVLIPQKGGGGRFRVKFLLQCDE